MSPFASLIKRYRESAGLTQESLAERSGLSVRGISDLERGARTRPQRATLERLADALELSPLDREAFVNYNGSRANPHSAIPSGGYLGVPPTGPLIGRTHDLDRVFSLADQISGTGKRVLFVAGEPGVGKTRFAQELTVALPGLGFLVLSGRCHEPERTAPFHPFLDVLKQANDSVSQQLRAEISTKWPCLGLLFPEWKPRHAAPPLYAEHDQQNLLRAIVDLLARLSSSQPIAIVLDDLQWADESSLRLIQYIARYSGPARILVIVTFRDVDVPDHHPIAVALLALRREGLADRVNILRLDEGEVGRFVESMIGFSDPAFVRRVHRLTNGNAFFIVEVIRTLIEHGRALCEDGRWDFDAVSWDDVPTNVRAHVTQRFSLLTNPTRYALQCASILGDGFSFDHLIEMSEMTEELLERALDEAALAGLVRGASPDNYVFGHALTHQAVYAGLEAHRRRRLHRTAGEMLEREHAHRSTGSAGDIARHYLAAGAPERAPIWLVAAGDRAAAIAAHPEAEGHYRRAMLLAQERNDQSCVAEIQSKLGAVLAAVGRYSDVRVLFEPALDNLLEATRFS